MIQRILTGLPLKVNYHQLKSTGTCYTINWFPLKVIWFQLKMPFNWYQLKVVLRSGRILTGLPLELSTKPVEINLEPVTINWFPLKVNFPVENATINWYQLKLVLRLNSYWSPVRSLLPPVEINWNLLQSTGRLLKVNWFQLKINWFQLKIPTGLTGISFKWGVVWQYCIREVLT